MVKIEQLKTDLLKARDYFNSVLDQVDDRWETQVYPDGPAWTVRQVLIHVADAARGHNNQAMGIAEGREVIPPDFDLERYNRRSIEKRAEKTVEEARTDLIAARTALLEWLDTIDESVLARRGRHATMEILSVGEIIQRLISHELEHAEDIRRALGLKME